MTNNAHEQEAAPHGYLCRYVDGDRMRPATEEEQRASQQAAEYDGGRGVILVDDVRCYVEE